MIKMSHREVGGRVHISQQVRGQAGLTQTQCSDSSLGLGCPGQTATPSFRSNSSKTLPLAASLHATWRPQFPSWSVIHRDQINLRKRTGKNIPTLYFFSDKETQREFKELDQSHITYLVSEPQCKPISLDSKLSILLCIHFIRAVLTGEQRKG